MLTDYERIPLDEPDMTLYPHLKVWEKPDCYFGEYWYGYVSAGVGQHRESDCLERSNFDTMVAELIDSPHFQKQDTEFHDTHPNAEPAQVVRENHWAVGWMEWIAIHPDATYLLQHANKLMESYDSYPVLDEERYWDYEYQECDDLWSNCYDWRERLELIREHYDPRYSDVSQAIKAVRGSWCDADEISAGNLKDRLLY